MDEDGVTKLGMSNEEFQQHLMELASTIIALKDKLFGKIALNPDYERLDYWHNFFGMCGIDTDKNLFMKRALRRYKIQGYIIGVYGNSHEPISELSRLSMGIAGGEKKKRDSGLKTISAKIKDKEIPPETSRNMELKKKRELDDTNSKIKRLIELEEQLKSLQTELDSEKKRPVMIYTQNEKNDDKKDDKKEREKKVKDEGIN